MFEGLFGSRRRSGPQKGQDIRYAVEIDFLDAVNGARRRLSMSDGKTLDVAIPAGVKSGQTLRLKSQGQPGQRGAPPGDAYLEITVGESAAYSRDGHDIRMTVNVSLTEAVAGGKVDVPAPQGPVTVKIPPGSNTGTTLRLKGKGVQVKDAPGNLYVTLAVVLPKKPDEALKRFVGDWSGDETPSRM